MTIRPFVIVLHARNHKGKVIAMGIDVATLLRNQAMASKNRSGNRVTATAKRLFIAEFLNGDASYVEHVENTLFRTPTASQSHVATLRNLIREDKLDELVWPTLDDNLGVCLVKLVAPVEDAN